MKGLFIPEITAEMFRNGCLESIEALMAEGQIYDIEHSPWTPISNEMPDDELPEGYQRVLVTVVNCFGKKVVRVAEYIDFIKSFRIKENNDCWKVGEKELLAWTPLPEPYKWKEDLDKLNERYKEWQEVKSNEKG